VVIFYDGINEAATAFENRTPGWTFDETARGREFNLLNQEFRLRLSGLAAYSLARFSYGGFTAEWLADKLARYTSYSLRTRLANDRLRAAGLPPAAEAPGPELADGVVRTYLFNKRAVEASAGGFAFRSLFFWQPVIFEKNRLSAFEKSVVEDEEREFPGHRDFFLETYRRLSEVSAREHVVDLSGIFTDNARSYYTDDAHLIEAGNAIVVSAMLPYVKAVVEENSVRTSDRGAEQSRNLAVQPRSNSTGR
jgi:hypothetical protein